jgi:ribosomal-protein-alanine N-acetyltransferase
MTLDDIFTDFPIIETEHLRLREIQFSDADTLHEAFADDDVMYYFGAMPHTARAETVNMIRQMHGWYARRVAIRWAITRKGEDELLGTCGFHQFDKGFYRAEIGYELRKQFWRQGIMTEALRGLLDFGFNMLNLRRIEATVDGDNEKSKRLLHKLGFAYEGCRKERFFHRDIFWDEHHFGLLKTDYSA